MTPYASKDQGAEWYEEQEEPSCPCYSEVGGFEERIPLPLKPMGRTLTGTRVPQTTPLPNGQCQEGDRGRGYYPGTTDCLWS